MASNRPQRLAVGRTRRRRRDGDPLWRYQCFLVLAVLFVLGSPPVCVPSDNQLKIMVHISTVFIAAILGVASRACLAFTSAPGRRGGSQLHAKKPTPKPLFPYGKKPPVYNKQTSLWEPSAETEDEPYGPMGSLLRGGPNPALIRVLQPEQYDQAVYKYMAQTRCSRIEAMGNMDSYFSKGPRLRVLSCHC